MITKRKSKSPGQTGPRVIVGRMPWQVRWTCYVFCFSLCFENYDPFGISASFTLSKMAGALFATACFWKLSGIFTKQHWTTWLLAWLWLVLAVATLIAEYAHPVPRSAFRGVLFSQAQCFLLYWLCTHVLRDRRTALRGILTYVVSAALMSVLMLLGIGREAIRETADFNRITFMGANANMIAIWAAAAIIIIVELCSRDILRWGNWRFALPILVLPLMIMIVQSGSRGGVISLGLGVVCFLFAPGLMGRRVMIGLGVLGILFGMFYLSKNSVLDERMQKTIETGSLAGREELWPEALRMVQEKPLLGWGMWNAADITEEAEAAPNGFLGELQGSDPHNVFLAFFVFGGALAGLPFLFMSGWWFYGTFAARHGPWGMLPFALTVFILSTMFKAGGFYLVKIPWILLAYATVVITTAAQSKPQQLSPRDRRAARKRVQEKTEIQKSES